jgi:hypothetical protein
LQTVLDLADWCHYFVDNWKRLTESFWVWIFALLGERFPPEAAAPTTFYVSLSAIALSAGFLQRTTNHKRGTKQVFLAICSELPLALAVAVWAMAIFQFLQLHLIFGADNSAFFDSRRLSLLLFFASGAGASTLIWRPLREILDNALLAIFIGVFFFLISLPSAEAAKVAGGDDARYYQDMIARVSYGLFPLQVMSLLTWARARFINYRFILVAFVVMALLALSWLSRLALSATAPAH